MKIRHLFLALALVAAAAACSAELTEPAAVGTVPDAHEMSSEAATDSIQREDAGWLGSGGG